MNDKYGIFKLQMKKFKSEACVVCLNNCNTE
jgi:hypothetical protein